MPEREGLAQPDTYSNSKVFIRQRATRSAAVTGLSAPTGIYGRILFLRESPGPASSAEDSFASRESAGSFEFANRLAQVSVCCLLSFAPR